MNLQYVNVSVAAADSDRVSDKLSSEDSATYASANRTRTVTEDNDVADTVELEWVQKNYATNATELMTEEDKSKQQSVFFFAII